MDLRLPKITATDADGKINQVKDYLYQLVQDLNYAIAHTENTVEPEKKNTIEMEASSIFASIKSFIMNSPDIINAYYHEIQKKLNLDYVKSTDYNAFVNKVDGENGEIPKLDERVTALDSEDGRMANAENRLVILEEQKAVKNVECDGDILLFAFLCEEGLTPIVTTINAESLPIYAEGEEEVLFTECAGTVHRTTNNVRIALYSHDGIIATNSYANEEWLGWKFLVPQ